MRQKKGHQHTGGEWRGLWRHGEVSGLSTVSQSAWLGSAGIKQRPADIST